MDNPLQSITELFDLPGASAAKSISPARDEEGKTAKESEELGKVCMADGDFEGAIAQFRRAMEQGGTDAARDLLNLGAAYEAADNSPAAFRQYRKARSLGDSGELRLGVAALMKRYGRIADAVAELQRAIEVEPENAYLSHRLAEVLRDNGHKKAALEAIHRAVASKPEDPFYHYWMGDLLLEMHRYEEAAQALQACLEFSPGDDHALMLTSLALWGAGRRAEAMRAIRLASDLAPEKLIYFGLLAKFLTQEGHEADAAAEAKKAAKMDDYDRDLLGRLEAQSGLSL